MLVTGIVLIIIIGCTAGVPRPGTSGKRTAAKIKTVHPDVPDGVKCYVCHKREMPDVEFHKKLGIKCDNCHGQTTWMATKYPHESWPLGIHRKIQCNRCHFEMEIYNFSVWQCWGCHHEQNETKESHRKRGHDNIDNCKKCHKGSLKPDKKINSL